MTDISYMCLINTSRINIKSLSCCGLFCIDGRTMFKDDKD